MKKEKTNDEVWEAEETEEELKAIERGEKVERFEVGSQKDIEYLERLVFGNVPLEEMLKR